MPKCRLNILRQVNNCQHNNQGKCTNYVDKCEHKVEEATENAAPSGQAELAGYDNLSDEAKETLKGMVEYCINHEFCMGMDGGYHGDDTKREFRVQLEQFCAS